jgi:hypothetical protein
MKRLNLFIFISSSHHLTASSKSCFSLSLPNSFSAVLFLNPSHPTYIMPLTKAFKTELRKAVKDNANDGQCLRCGTFLGKKSHLFRNCPEKPIDTFVRGRGNQPSPADRSEAEALYQEICKESDPSWAPPTESDVKLPLNAAIEAKDTPKGRKNTNTTKNTGDKTAGAVKNQASTSTPSTLKSRTPVKDDKLGYLEPQSTVQKEEQEPQVGEDGILEVDTTFLGPPVNKAKGEFEIMSNYVQVKSIPKDLYVYSLKYWHPKPGSKPGTTIDQVVFNKRVEIMRAYKALHKLDRFHLTVNGCIWATDYKTLWSSSPLPQCSTALDAIWTTENAAFRDLKGENIEDMRATLTTKVPLRDLPKAFQENNVADLDDHIRALNAHVSRSVEQVTQDGNVPVTQIGVNKFYLNRGFKDMDRHGTLRGLRGYYTSIRSGRSGTLLNINTATSAFFAPITVAQMLRTTPGPTTDKMSFVEKTLFGANLRVLYRRKNYDETPNLDLNSEEARSRTFKQFGKPAETQRFFTLLPADPRNPTAPRKCDPADTRGRTVEEYLQKECNINLRNICTDAYDWLCVNVGNIVKVSDDERERSAKRAQWIPACLLEIVQHQPVRGLLGPNHTKSMIDLAVHLPRRNAELITTEGFQSLGIYPGQNVTNGLQSLGLELDHKLVSLAAKTITAPAVTYRRPGNNASKVTKDIDPITASWNLQHVAFADTPPTDFRQIHVMGLKRCFGRTNIGNMSEQEALEALCTDFVSKLNEHSVQSSKGYCGTSQLLDVGPLKAWFKLCKPNDCTLVLLSDKDYDGYAKLKRTADCEEGQHTICAIGSKIKLSGPARHQHFSNLALKVNMKMGGANHFLHSGKLDMLLGRSRRSGTIILGADVTHPGHGTKEGSPSIACVVGSVDGEFMNYPGSMRLQAGKQEVSTTNLQYVLRANSICR